MALIDNAPRLATVTASVDTQVAVIRRHQILNRLDRADPVIAQLMRTMMKRFRGTEKVLLAEGDRSEQRQGLTLPEQNPTTTFSAYGDLLRESEVEEAIRAGEIHAFFQPIVDLAGRRLFGFEALVHWRHPQRGIMEPNVFVPLAEKSGLIVPIDRHMANLAARFIKRVNKAIRRDPVSVSLNLSSHGLRDMGVVKTILAAARDAGIDPRWLQIEVTETTLIADTSLATDIVRELRNVGIKTALDDFGTGCSNMSYLTELPIRFLKVDRSFVDNLTHSDSSRKVVRSIVGLAKSMGLDTIAEGIETVEQEDLVREFGCDLGQGYLFGRPMPPEDALAWCGHWTGDAGPSVGDRPKRVDIAPSPFGRLTRPSGSRVATAPAATQPATEHDDRGKTAVP